MSLNKIHAASSKFFRTSYLNFDRIETYTGTIMIILEKKKKKNNNIFEIW